MKLSKKYFLPGLAMAMVFALLCSCSAAQTGAAYEGRSSVEAESTYIVGADTAAPKHSDTDGKEETVYVVADAYGSPTEVVSSIWLKNASGSTVIEDVTSLKDIENTQGDETFTQKGESLKWQANGSDIYYQGTAAETLPLTVKIAYELDGKTVTPEKLAGASGHLKISFSYENNTAVKKTINGKEVTLYQPFVVMSGLMLDGKSATNVRVTNGRSAGTADNSLVMGMAMPGLRESLGLDEMKDSSGNPLKADIPESVSIEADVTDFELITTITMVDNTMLNDVDLDNVNSIDDLQAAIRDLKSASSELKDGTGTLYDGTAKLYDGAAEFKDGVKELDNGVGELKDGAGQLKEGTSALKDGADELKNGAAGLYNGALALNSALKGNDGKSLYEGVQAIGSGADEISAGLKSGDQKKPGIFEAAGGIQKGAKEISDGAGQIAAGAEQIKNELAGELNNITAQIEAAHNSGLINDLQYLAIKSYLADYSTKMDGLYKALDEMKAGADSIAGGAKSGDAKNPGIYEAAGGIASGSSKLKDGVDGISDGAGALKDGIDEMTNDENLGAMIAGLKALEGGAGTAGDGAAKLDEGAAALKDGIATLKDGTGKLSEGGTSLSEGIASLKEGAKALNEGMTKFDEEGIKKLSDISDGDLSNFMERLRALQKLGREYISFSGIKEGMPGKVQFIIRTESIEKE